MSDEQIIKDLSIRLRSIESELQRLHVSVAEVKANQKVVNYVGGVGLTAVVGIVAKLLMS